jgi:hypothetical protein
MDRRAGDMDDLDNHRRRRTRSLRGGDLHRDDRRHRWHGLRNSGGKARRGCHSDRAGHPSGPGDTSHRPQRTAPQGAITISCLVPVGHLSGRRRHSRSRPDMTREMARRWVRLCASATPWEAPSPGPPPGEQAQAGSAAAAEGDRRSRRGDALRAVWWARDRVRTQVARAALFAPIPTVRLGGAPGTAPPRPQRPVRPPSLRLRPGRRCSAVAIGANCPREPPRMALGCGSSNPPHQVVRVPSRDTGALSCCVPDRPHCGRGRHPRRAVVPVTAARRTSRRRVTMRSRSPVRWSRARYTATAAAITAEN